MDHFWEFDRPEPYYWSKALREKNIFNFLGPFKKRWHHCHCSSYVTFVPFAHLHLQISDTDHWLLTPRLSFDWRTWLEVGRLPSFLLARHSLHSRVLLPAAAIKKRPIYLGRFRWLTHPNYFASGMFILDRFTLGFFCCCFSLRSNRYFCRREEKKKKKKVPPSCILGNIPTLGHSQHV